MLKAVVAATAAVTIAGTSMAYAQPREGRPDGGRFQPSIEDMRAFQAARLAALRAGLMLTPEQEKNWPAFEQAVKEFQQQRLDRMNKRREARREGERPAAGDPPDRLRQRADRMFENGAALRRLADAMEPLYRSLDEGQKRRFAMLTRMGGMRGMWQQRRGGRDDGEHRGGRDRGENRGGRDGGEQRMPRHWRTDATPNGQPAERTFGRKAIATEPAQFGGKLSQFGAKSFGAKSPDGVSFRGKVTLAEPTGFGGKLVREI